MGAGTVYLNRDIETEKLECEMGAGNLKVIRTGDCNGGQIREIEPKCMTFAHLSARKTDGECTG